MKRTPSAANIWKSGWATSRGPTTHRLPPGTLRRSITSRPRSAQSSARLQCSGNPCACSSSPVIPSIEFSNSSGVADLEGGASRGFSICPASSAASSRVAMVSRSLRRRSRFSSAWALAATSLVAIASPEASASLRRLAATPSIGDVLTLPCPSVRQCGPTCGQQHAAGK